LASYKKLNTKSSTEAELVAIEDVMGQVLWTRHLVAKGLHLTPMTIYQEYKSAILLSENGRMSNSKRMRHLNVRYFS
jgi:beta-glucosidase/6-phospho-beta-glucosidase/beta-galactosidase